MEKRQFLKTGFWATAAAFAAPLLDACNPANSKKMGDSKSSSATGNPLPPPKNLRVGDFTLPALGYDFAALEPHVDKQTMEIHHDRHHAAYVKNLNDALVGHPMQKFELEDLLPRLTDSDGDRKIRNNGGGHWNHTMFWQIIRPGGKTPSGGLAAAIDRDFGSMDKFKEQFSTAAKSVFGSGWAWLSVGSDKKLFISSTPNQDNPLMKQLVKQSGTPVLCLDVWEHAYYLKYQNKRPDYVSAFWNVVNWEEANARFERAM